MLIAPGQNKLARSALLGLFENKIANRSPMKKYPISTEVLHVFLVQQQIYFSTKICNINQ
jgi:hypothetical protein